MIGRGPGEILYPPFISWLSFDDFSSPSAFGIYDWKGNYIEIDIDESIETGVSSWKCVFDSLALDGGAGYLMAADRLLMLHRVNATNDGYERLLVDSTGDIHANAAMKRLNEAKVQDFNTVASLMLINRQTGQESGELLRCDIAEVLYAIQ